MIIGKGVKQPERVLVTMTWIKHDNLIFLRLVVIFIKSKKLIDSQIGIHTADTVHENVRATILVLNGDMVNDTLMNKPDKLWRMCVTGKRILCIFAVDGSRCSFSIKYFNMDG